MKKRDSENYLSWEAAVPLVTNRFLLYDQFIFISMGWFLFSIVGGLIFYFLARKEGITFFQAFVSVGVPVGGLLLLMFGFFVVMGLLFLKNRYYARYVINGAGVSCETKRGAAMDAPHEAAAWSRYLSFRPWGYPQGEMDYWGRAKWVEWRQAPVVTEHPASRVITLGTDFLPVIRLYCPDEETYRRALAIAKEETARESEEKTA